ncbi:MAG: glycosyltransferase family 4 protein [Chloroflexi bacterium]|nr:glycosyltransferase family 4 protein [Chloroflexota bacterium]
MRAKIAYLVSRFPHLPETFILREMNELERQGWQIVLYPLIQQRQSVIHAEAEKWIRQARYSPFLSLEIAKANLRTMLRKPKSYFVTWARVIRENLVDLDFLARAVILFPKAVFMAARMQSEGIEHIHAHYATHPALVAWIIHQFTGISYSVTVHAHDIFVCQAMLKTKLDNAAFVVAISEYNRRYLEEQVNPRIGEKTHIVHCGIDTSQYRLAEQKPVPGDPFEILNIGSLQPYKGQIYLLQACVHLRDWGIPFHCRIIGEGNERSKLERFIADNDLHGQVELLGPQPQESVTQLLSTVHCYVQPSVVTDYDKMEGIPVALMEAMASRLPVIATDLSGIPELVHPGQTGLLVPPKDATAVANAIRSLYDSPENYKQMATMGRQVVHRDFEIRKNVGHLASLFEQLNSVK